MNNKLKEIQEFLENQSYNFRLEQFGMDVIEELTETSHNYFLSDNDKTNAIHYYVQNILEVIKEDTKCYPMFLELSDLLNKD